MIYFIPQRYTTPKWQAQVVALDKHFHFHEGPSAASLMELKNALNSIPDTVLEQHVNQEKNDIADWVQFVIRDVDLATALRKQTHRWGLIVALERQMMRTLNLPPYVAKRWLDPGNSPLMLTSGERVSSLEELSSVLESVSDETIDYHLERIPNDIAQWVLLDVGDYQLAEILEEASNRSQMQRFISDHIAMLKDAMHE
jgi:hypothetical protein